MYETLGITCMNDVSVDCRKEEIEYKRLTLVSIVLSNGRKGKREQYFVEATITSLVMISRWNLVCFGCAGG